MGVDLRHLADHDDISKRLCIEWQYVVVVLQQYGRLNTDRAGLRTTRSKIDWRLHQRLPLENAHPEHLRVTAQQRPVEIGLVELPRCERRVQQRRGPDGWNRHQVIQAREHRRRRAPHRKEIRLNVPLEAPLGTQHVGQQFLVLARLEPVDRVVRTHDGGGIPILDRHLERQQVELVQYPPVDRLLDRHAVRFLLISCEMLGHRDDALGLDSFDFCDSHRAGQVGIFAEVLEIAPEDGDAGHVHTGRFEHVQREIIGLGAYHVAE